MPRKARDVPWLDQIGRVYYVFWYDKSKRRTERLSLGTEEAGEATRRYAAFLIESGEITKSAAPAGVGLTVEAALDDYLREHVDVATADPERAHMAAKPLRAHFGEELVKALGVEACRDYVRARVAGIYGRKVTTATARRELAVLAAAANHAVKWRRLPKADLPVFELPEGSAPSTRWLTQAEFAKFKTAAPVKIRDLIDVLYYTGSRREAIETLTVFQVKLDQGLIHLSKAGERVTRKRRPVVPIDPAIMPTMRRLVAQALERPDGRLFDLHPYGVYRAFLAASKAAGVEPVTPHVLRHTRASHLLQAGVSIWAVAKLLGDTVATVEKTYGHSSPSYLAEVLGGPVEKDGSSD